MTMAQVQPLNIPTASELAKAHDFLYESAILVADVKSLLLDSSKFAMVARLKNIQGCLGACLSNRRISLGDEMRVGFCLCP